MIFLASAALLVLCLLRWAQLADRRRRRAEERSHRVNTLRPVANLPKGRQRDLVTNAARALDAAAAPAMTYLDEPGDGKPTDQLAAMHRGDRQCTICGWYSPDVRERETGEVACDECSIIPF